jgi:hypothetical protein
MEGGQELLVKIRGETQVFRLGFAIDVYK